MQRLTLEHAQDRMANAEAGDRPVSRSQVADFIAGTYRWMAVGLMLTAAVAYGVASTPALAEAIIGNKLLFFGLIGAELIMVLVLSMRIQKLSRTAATTMFLGYSALNGATLSVIFLAYTAASIGSTFVIAGGMFGGMALYGTRTDKDLTSWGSFLFMGLIGIVLAIVVNLFLQSSMLSWIISGAGVLIFTGLAAYDAQRIKQMGMELGNRGEAAAKASIMGALALYLDFINLFLMLLRFLGESRD